MTYYGRWTYKYEEAARRGAAGVLIVHETAPASYGWNTVKNSNTNTMFDIVRENPAAEHTPFESWIQRAARACRSFAAPGLDFEQAKAAAQPRGLPADPAQGDAQRQLSAQVAKITSHNVVGRLPGKKHPDETVIYTAHWDHLGIGKPDATRRHHLQRRGRQRHRHLPADRAGARLRAWAAARRSVVFLAVTAEEKGLLGSEYYATAPALSARQDGRRLNMDSMGFHGPGEELHHLGQRQARPAGRSHRRRQARRPLLHARPAPGEPAASTAPTISPSPSRACRRSASSRATTW